MDDETLDAILVASANSPKEGANLIIWRMACALKAERILSAMLHLECARLAGVVVQGDGPESKRAEL